MSSTVTNIVAAAFFAALTSSLHAGPGTFDLTWNTVDAGGATFSTGGTFSLGGTIGQQDANAVPLTGGTFSLSGGFWPGTDPAALPCPADLFPTGNGDHTVGSGDLAQLLSKWGACPPACPEDIAPVGAPDGTVGSGDLAQLLSAWGQCP